jgi:hypothetical protein
MRPSLQGFFGTGIANNRQTPPDQGGLSDVLAVYSDAYGSSYINDVRPDSGIYPSIAARETTAGYTTKLISTYTNFLAEDLSKYAHIWDIGYDTRLSDTAVQNKYLEYLQNGGAVFFLGENSNFITRNNDICSMILLAGGGPYVSVTNTGYGVISASTASEFLLASSNGAVTFYAPGQFNDIGSGTPFTTGGLEAVMWKTGSLANAEKGAIVAVLDVNFLSSNPQPDFIDNLAICLNKK